MLLSRNSVRKSLKLLLLPNFRHCETWSKAIETATKLKRFLSFWCKTISKCLITVKMENILNLLLSLLFYIKSHSAENIRNVSNSYTCKHKFHGPTILPSLNYNPDSNAKTSLTFVHSFVSFKMFQSSFTLPKLSKKFTVLQSFR